MFDIVTVLLAGAGVVAVVAAILRSNVQFLLTLLLVKPFIDLSANAAVTVGETSANALDIVGLVALVGLIRVYFGSGVEIGRSVNGAVIALLLAANATALAVNGMLIGSGALGGWKHMARLLDAYLFYFVAILLLGTEERRCQVIRLVWLSLTAVAATNVIVYFTGAYNVDVTRGVARYAGLYNDPGSPSYLSTIAAIFGTLYMEKTKQDASRLAWTRIAYGITLVAWLIIISITITKSAMLMSTIFVLMWWGRYKRKTLIVAPALVLIGYLVYTNVEVVQIRFGSEAAFFTADQITDTDIDGLGTGRGARFRRLYDVFMGDMDAVQRTFGTGRSFAAHNQLVAQLMRTGIVGLCLFCLMIATFTIRLRRVYRLTRLPEVYMANVLLFCFLGLSVSGQPFEWTTPLWYLMLMLGLANLRSEHVFAKAIHVAPRNPGYQRRRAGALSIG